MKELLILLLIGISLSIDAFSVSTCLGMCDISLKRTLKISLTVGLFHFIMPILGVIISYQLHKILLINSDIILGIILLLLGTQLFIETIKPSNKEINNTGTLLFAFGVSLDSFSVGLGLSAITDNLLLASTIFTVCSFSFTFLGLTIGKYINKLLKKYSYLLGTILLTMLGIIFLIKGI